ncbi:MAG: ATP-dependent DNA ligase [Cytophagales bacterium]|nr:ATP-dependent DNA ligase [Bernardetiaceae bacterium]MDW8211838.1 ATP-dependent DNA ligase [Cytophagales bacterium]
MKDFAELFAQLDSTNKTNARLKILKQYLSSAPDEDKLWLIALFCGKRPRRQVTTTQLRQWTAAAAGIPEWLLEESYHVTGDLAETISLLLPPPKQGNHKSLSDWMAFLQSLNLMDEESKKANLMEALDQLSQQERFVFIKLITGGFRVGVSQLLLIRAIAEAFHIHKAEVAQRLMGQWQAESTTFQELLFGKQEQKQLSQPYPFCLAYPLEEDKIDQLGPTSDWQAEWKWDGIRAQLIVRQKQLFIWSRGEELVTEKYPELHPLASKLPVDCVLDGELLAWKENFPLSFAALQKRIGRKTVTKKIVAEIPVVFLAYDLLEYAGIDMRHCSLSERRSQLEHWVDQVAFPALKISPILKFESWQELMHIRQQARANGAEGIMLKKLSSSYQTGRVRGHWWKWKAEPLSIEGVLMYAQKGHGRRATLYTDYTFGVWDGNRLVSFAKAYSGLTDEEIKKVDAFIKKNTLEKFGPVRTVKPALVFEIGFEGIQPSQRHKSGVAVRFPRILRWRTDKKPEQANTLADLHALAQLYADKSNA